MDLTILNILLRETESTSLDFKRDQYPFVRASDDEKSELLKDVLAFANSWRHADAYILIGVDEKGGNAVVGVNTHLDDASLQQFINSKTQKPVTFSYETVQCEGKEIDVLRIPVQERPFYLQRDFAGLKKDTVYIRRGSSTDIATPAEIADMGKASVALPRSPALEVEFVDPLSLKGIGPSIQLESTDVSYEAKNVPDYSMDRGLYGITIGENRHYYRERARYIKRTELIKKVKLRVVSMSTELAEDVVLTLNVDRQIKYSCDRRHGISSTTGSLWN